MKDLLIEQDEQGWFTVWWKRDDEGLLSCASTRDEAIRSAMVRLAAAMLELGSVSAEKGENPPVKEVFIDPWPDGWWRPIADQKPK